MSSSPGPDHVLHGIEPVKGESDKSILRHLTRVVDGAATSRTDGRLAVISIIVAMLLVSLGHAWFTARLQEAAQSPVTYVGKWNPSKAKYQPGEVMHFEYLRRADLDGEDSLLIVTVDSFENLDTHEVYPSFTLVRQVERDGDEHLKTVRVLPDIVPPGRYRLEGFVTSYTRRRTQPAKYTSEEFIVTKRGDTTSSILVTGEMLVSWHAMRRYAEGL